MSQGWDQEEETKEPRPKRDEKEEKKDEKDEKDGGRRDPLGGLTGGLVLIMIGAGLLLWMQGWITEWWLALGLFFLGLAAITLFEGLVRLFLPAYRQPIVGRLVSVVVLGLLGTGFLGFGYLGPSVWQYWPIVIIAIGVVVLIGAILGPLFRR